MKRTALRVAIAFVVMTAVVRIDQQLIANRTMSMLAMRVSMPTRNSAGVYTWPSFGRALQVRALWYAAAFVVPYAALGLVPYFRPPHGCRCRACGHELCGLTEPRCPECGEAI